MRIISWFAMVCFLLEFRTQFSWYLGTVNCLSTPSCVSFRAKKNGRRKADPFPCRSDIRSAIQKQFSRPMTGHTPQKLPLFGRNLLHHRSAQRRLRLHALDYLITQATICQYLF
jgi:hypothetical protein